MGYLQELVERGYPIGRIAEESYSGLVNGEEANLYQIDTYELQRKAEERLREFFAARIPVPVSYKSNDAILCQLFREGKLNVDRIGDCRTDSRRMTYSRERADHSVVLITEVVDNDSFIKLIQDSSVRIIF